jgi:hypothetical protein
MAPEGFLFALLLRGERRHIIITVFSPQSMSAAVTITNTNCHFGTSIPRALQNHRRFQIAVRKFVDDIIFPDAQAREDDGKRPSQAVFDAMAQVNLIAMRLGPGKHLEGRVLMNGIVKAEVVSVNTRLPSLMCDQGGARCTSSTNSMNS